MKRNINIDILGGLSLLGIAAFFYVQLGDDFSMFGLFFPERMLPILTAFAVIILVKGFVRPTKLEKPIFQINGTMLLAMIVGALWVMLLESAGFVLTSFLSVFSLQIAYMPKENRSLKSVFANLVGSLAVVLFFYYLFTQYLGVTLPDGSWWN